MHNLSASCRITRGATATAGAAGQTTVTSGLLDMSGFQSVLALIPLGAIAAGGACVIKWQGGELANGSDLADLAGTAQTFGDADDDKLVWAELTPLPEHRYVQVTVSRTGANVTLGGIIFIQFNGRRSPATHGSGVVGELHVDPAEGTA